jgi:histidinol-phosphate/aromatic aminotransferase/cobyric acid decarboxylase-like protein
MSVSRRNFVSGIAAALGYLGTGPEIDVLAQGRPQAPGGAAPRMRPANDDYDSFAHISSNENCWGPSENVMKAMNSAWKYSNRYGYPDGNLVGEIAKHHGVKPENVP